MTFGMIATMKTHSSFVRSTLGILAILLASGCGAAAEPLVPDIPGIPSHKQTCGDICRPRIGEYQARVDGYPLHDKKLLGYVIPSGSNFMAGPKPCFSVETAAPAQSMNVKFETTGADELAAELAAALPESVPAEAKATFRLKAKETLQGDGVFSVRYYTAGALAERDVVIGTQCDESERTLSSGDIYILGVAVLELKEAHGTSTSLVDHLFDVSASEARLDAQVKATWKSKLDTTVKTQLSSASAMVIGFGYNKL